MGYRGKRIGRVPAARWPPECAMRKWILVVIAVIFAVFRMAHAQTLPLTITQENGRLIAQYPFLSVRNSESPLTIELTKPKGSTCSVFSNRFNIAGKDCPQVKTLSEIKCGLD